MNIFFTMHLDMERGVEENIPHWVWLCVVSMYNHCCEHSLQVVRAKPILALQKSEGKKSEKKKSNHSSSLALVLHSPAEVWCNTKQRGHPPLPYAPVKTLISSSTSLLGVFLHREVKDQLGFFRYKLPLFQR